LTFCGGSIRTTGLPAATHSPSRYGRIEYATGTCGDDGLLIELPARLVDGGLRRGNLRRLRLDLLAAIRQRGDGQLASQLRRSGGGCRARSAGVVELLPRNSADCELRLVARELVGGLLLVDLRLLKLRARDVLFGRPLARR
jgi:hypothetical protein